jgi:hypothetical protein
LIKRIRIQKEYNLKINNTEEKSSEKIAHDIIKSIPGFENFPKEIPEWVDENLNHHNKQKLDLEFEFRKIFGKNSINKLFRKYYRNEFKSTITKILFWFSLILSILNIFIIWFAFGLKPQFSPFPKYSDNYLLALYCFLPLIYGIIISLIFKSMISSQVRPSKWHWFDTLIVIIIPMIFYIYEYANNFLILNLLLNQTPSIKLENFIIIINLWDLVLIVILAFSTITYSIIPCTKKGQIFYAILNLEISAEVGGGSNIKNLPKNLYLLLSSLDEFISDYFNLLIDNKNKIQEQFNIKLLKGGRDFITQIKFLDQEGLIEFFSKQITSPEKRLLNKIKLRKVDKERKKSNCFLQILDSINLIFDRLDKIALKPTLTRTTLKKRIFLQSRKIYSYIIAFISFFVTGVLPLFI